MQLENQSHVPDVLFVDEDGNPIEAGHESILYVDENGIEIPEEIAVQLLESGKYIDTRQLYSDTETQPTSVFGTLSKSSVTNVTQQELSRLSSNQAIYQAQAQAQAQAQMEAQMQAMALAEAQAKIFAKASAELKQREEELASIEADARGDTPLSVHQRQKSSHSVRSISNTELQVQKSQSGRRLLQPPAKKVETKSSENMIREAQINEELENQAQRIAELREHELLKERLLQKQREILEQSLQQRVSRQSEQEVEQLRQETAQSYFNQQEIFQEQQQQQQNTVKVVHQHQKSNEDVKQLSPTPINLNSVKKETTKEFTDNFKIGQFKFVGYLTGKNVIKNSDELSLENIEKLYEKALRDLSPSKSTEENSNDLDPSLFNDEIVEIDFGPIDAYTAALNAHINSQKNLNETDEDSRFPAHVLTCSHATFIDNQLMLGEPMYNTFESANVVNGTSGVNVEFYQADEEATKFSRTNTQVEYENGQYSRSQSFASMVDIQSQNGYSIGESNQQNHEQYQESNNYYSNVNRETTMNDTYVDAYQTIMSKQTNGFYTNTESLSGNNYVSR